MSDLWDDYNEGGDDQISDDEMDKQPQSGDSDDDLDYMLPDSKRQKLNRKYKQGKKRKAGKGGVDVEKDAVDLLSDSDSDKQLLHQAKADEKKRKPDPSPEVASRALKGQPVRSRLDARSELIMQQATAALRHLHQVVDLPDEVDDDEVVIEESPEPQRYAGRQVRQVPSGEEDVDDGDGGGDDYWAGGGQGEEEAKVKLKVKCSKGDLVYRVRMNDKLGKMFDLFSQHALERGWIASLDGVKKFEFDGERVGPDATPLTLELEDDDSFDAYI